MRKAYKFRIYPDAKQEELFRRTVGCCRLVYNLCLIIVVDPAHTSQCCSVCGTVDAASRISRSRFVCINCGSIFDADVNAAKNILKLGISPTGGLPGMACVSSQTIGRKQEEDARKGRSSVLRVESSHSLSAILALSVRGFCGA